MKHTRKTNFDRLIRARLDSAGLKTTSAAVANLTDAICKKLKIGEALSTMSRDEVFRLSTDDETGTEGTP